MREREPHRQGGAGASSYLPSVEHDEPRASRPRREKTECEESDAQSDHGSPHNVGILRREAGGGQRAMSRPAKAAGGGYVRAAGITLASPDAAVTPHGVDGGHVAGSTRTRKEREIWVCSQI